MTKQRLEDLCEFKALAIEANRCGLGIKYRNNPKQDLSCDLCNGYNQTKECYFNLNKYQKNEQ